MPPDPLAAALRALIEEVARDPAGQERLQAFPYEKHSRVAKVQMNGHTFCLCRFPTSCLKVLTKRQKQIAGLVAEGLPNKDIAQALDIKPATVASHVVRIFKKMGVSSRAGLASHCFLIKR